MACHADLAKMTAYRHHSQVLGRKLDLRVEWVSDPNAFRHRR
jgi:hypothetical protein